MARIQVEFDGISRGAVNAARQTRAAIKSVGDEGDRTANRIGFMGRVIRYSLVRAAYAGGAGLLALGGAVGFVGFKFDNLKQQAGIAFTTMLGSGRKAQAFLSELQKFAARTPFEFPDLIRASQRLLAMGFSAKSIVPTLTAVGNAVAGLGGDPVAMDATIRAIGQIQAKGRLMAEEMMQLNEAGTFSWKALAFEIGKSVPEAMALVQKGAVTSDIFLTAFQRNSDRRFKGMMDKQSQTFGGLLSTLKDMFSQLAGTAMKPLFDLATSGMKQIVNANGDVQKSASDTAHAFGVRLADSVRRVVLYFRRNWPAIRSFLRQTASAAVDVAGVLRTIASAANRVSGAIGGWGESFKLIIAGVLAAKMMKVVLALRAIRIGLRTTAVTAEATAVTMRAAMASTGVGLLVLAATEIILHWKQVRKYLLQFGIWLDSWAIKLALKVVEPFSHLPAKLGGWARKAKTKLAAELDKFDELKAAAARSGEAAGRAWADAFGAPVQHAIDGVPTRFGPGSVADLYKPGGQLGPRGSAGSGKRVVHVARGAARSRGAGSTGFHLPNERTPYDCSAFVQAVYRQAGITIAGTTYTQVRQGRHVEKGDLRPGDLIFMNFPGERSPGHVGIYVGGGMMVHDHGASGGVEEQAVPWGSVVDLRTYVAGGGSAAINPPGDTGDPAVGGFDLSGGTGGTSKKKGPAGPAKADPAERRRDLAGVRWLEGHILKVAPQLRARIRREMNGIGEAIRDATTESELAKATTRLERLKKKLNDALLLTTAISNAKKSARSIAKEIAKLPASMRADLERRMEAVREGLTHVTTARSLAKLRKELEKIQKAVADALDKMRQAVEDRRDAFSTAFGVLADKALAVFDAKTQELLNKARAVVAEFGFEIGVGEQTPTEKLLSQRSEERTAAQEAERIADLERQLAGAQDAEERARLEQELADARYDAETSRLEKIAERERVAADKAIADEQKRIQDERDAKREKFVGKLAEIEADIVAGKMTAAEAQAAIAQAMADAGIDAATAADLIGPAFMATLTAAMTTVEAALRDLITAINDLNGVLGEAPAGGGDGSQSGSGHFAGGGGGNYRGDEGGAGYARFVGKEAVKAVLGEDGVGQGLADALRVAMQGSGGGGRVLSGPIYVLGTTEREVGAALARITEPHLGERISYRVGR